MSGCVFFPRKLKLWSWEPKWQYAETVSWEPKGILPNAVFREKYGPIRGLWRNHDGCRGGGVLLDSRDNIEQGSWWVECTVCCGKDIVTVLDLVSQVVILVHSYTGYTDTDWTNQGLLCVFGCSWFGKGLQTLNKMIFFSVGAIEPPGYTLNKDE